MYNDTNTQKGVTLIALAVTIIVMLILAGETISTLIGKGGITSRVTEARDKNAIAKVEEEAQIEYSDLLMNNQIDSIGEDITIGNIKERMERKGYEIKTIGCSSITLFPPHFFSISASISLKLHSFYNPDNVRITKSTSLFSNS